MFKKKSVVPDKMIPVTKFAFAKEKNGSLIRYFGIPVAVDVTKKRKDQFLTVGGIDTRKLVSILWVNAPEKVSEETREWQKSVLKIDVVNESDIDHPVILVDNRLLKFHIGGLSKKQVRAIIAFYSAKAMMCMADGTERLLDYLNTVADENSAKTLFNRIAEASDDALEYVSEADTLALQLLLAASEVNILPKKIQRSVAKNEKKIGIFATKQFKIGKKELRKVEKAEKKAAKQLSKVDSMRSSDDEPSDEDVEEINTDLNVEEPEFSEEEVKTESPKKKSVKTKNGKDLTEMLTNIQEKLDKSSEEDPEEENAEATPNKKEKSSK